MLIRRNEIFANVLKQQYLKISLKLSQALNIGMIVLIWQLGSMRCKHNDRWQLLSRMKTVAFALIKTIISIVTNAAGYHPGPEAPSRADGSPVPAIATCKLK